MVETTILAKTYSRPDYIAMYSRLVGGREGMDINSYA